MIVGSLFSGIGGLDLGLERAGHTVAWQCEIDQHCRGVLARHWPDTPCYDDATTLDPLDVRRVDLLVGGFPCQDLSVAGRRRGLAGARSGLFWEFTRVASALRPAWLLLENVPGLLSSNGGRDFGVVVDELARLGYGVAWRILDAQYYGVAQRRRRLFVVGHLAADAGRAAGVLVEPRCVCGDSPPRRAAREGPAGAAGACSARGGGAGGSVMAVDINSVTSPQNHSRLGPDRPCHTIMAEHPPHVIVEPVADTLLTREGSTYCHAGYNPRPRNLIASGSTVRRLMLVECERLQGLPDNWTRLTADGREQSDTQRYRQIGNAVAVPVAEWIGRRLGRATQRDRGRYRG